MTFAQVALEDFPVALWVLDSSTPHLDYTGFNNSATSKVVEATNLAPDPMATRASGSTGPNQWSMGRWFGAGGNTGTHTLTGGSDGPFGQGTYLRKTWTVANGNAYGDTGIDLTGFMPVVAGETYTVSWYVRSSVSIAYTYLSVYYNDSTRNNTPAINYNIPQNVWARQVVTFTVPEGKTGARLALDNNGTFVVGSTLDMTGLTIIKGTVSQPFFSGASTYKTNLTNLAFNPSFENGLIGWNNLTVAGTLSNPSDITAYSGNKYLRVTIAEVGSNSRGVWGMDIPVVPGEVYSLGTMARSSRGARLSLSAEWINYAGNGIVSTSGAQTDLGTNWTWCKAENLTVPAGAARLRITLYSNPTGGNWVVGDTIDYDSVIAVKGATVPAYFDGNTVDPYYDYYWRGTPGSSVSDRATKGYSFEWSGAVNNSNSVMVAPNQYHAALVKGASKALIVSDSQRLSVNAPIMKRGKEDQPFTIEVTIRPIKRENSVAQQQIFGNPSVMDGLVVSGTKVSFSTKYTSSGEAKCEFDVQEYQTMRIHALHSKTRNALYINGDLVDEAILTDEQKADTYLAAGEALSCGASTSTNAIAMNGLAIYTRTLDEGDIDQHQDEAADNMDEFTVGAAYGGMTFALNSSTSKAILEYNYTDDWQWHMGMMNQVIVAEGQLVPQTSADVSLPGTWETVLPLPPSTNLSSITMNWLGENEKVYTSLDGVNWSQERRSARISTVSDGFDTTDKVLYLRVAFDGGKLNDPAYFDSLLVSMYGPINTTMPSLETRTMTLTNGSIEVDFDVTDYHENWGIEINNGTFSLSGASTTSMAPRTIQVWAKKGSGAFSDNMQASAFTWYTNDTTVSQEYQTDEWQLRTYLFPTGWSDAITFTGSGQIGCVLIYSNELTLDQIKESYLSFTGTRTIKFPTSGSMSVIDISSAVEIYEYNWGIESAG